MTPLELSVSDATIWNITVGLNITIPKASFTLIYDAYSTCVTYDYHQLMIVICLQHGPYV